MVKCEQCGNEYDAMEGGGKCPFCSRITGVNIGMPEGETSGAGNGNARGDSAWERRGTWLDVSAMWDMIRGVLLDPMHTFRRMKFSGDLGSPIIFALILGTIGMLGSLFWNMVIQGMGFFAGNHRVEELYLSTGLMAILTIFSPVFVLIGLFIASGILHVCLLITGGAKNGFEATFRVVAYASGSTALFQLIPFGGLVGGVWTIVAQVIGAREMHETTTGRALLAVLLPLIFCCGCALLLLSFGVGAGILAWVFGR
jgi:hypothetical protein